jgi:hypothetical protein
MYLLVNELTHYIEAVSSQPFAAVPGCYIAEGQGRAGWFWDGAAGEAYQTSEQVEEDAHKAQRKADIAYMVQSSKLRLLLSLTPQEIEAHIDSLNLPMQERDVLLVTVFASKILLTDLVDR